MTGHSRQRTTLARTSENIPEWDVEGQMDRVKGKWQCRVSHPFIWSAVICCHMLADRHGPDDYHRRWKCEAAQVP